MWNNWEERTVDLNNHREVETIRAFLYSFDLTFDADVDYTMAIFQDDTLVATGSRKGEVLRNIAVSSELQGQGLTAIIVSHLIRQAANHGIFHYFIYTRPDKLHLFTALGFNELARVEPYAALLESGIGSLADTCRDMVEQTRHLPPGTRAGLVVNCNPFTRGHQELIARAAAENPAVIVMVVSEEGSLFPFSVRIRLVREGMSGYPNVAVVPGGKYIVSAATFPGYFTRGEETVIAQTKLDALVFAKYIAKDLAIETRYIGDEPYCPVTRAYNQALMEILPVFGISVRLINRVTDGQEFISASKVRDWIRSGEWGRIRKAVPDSTFYYLQSKEAEPIITAIKNSQSRH